MASIAFEGLSQQVTHFRSRLSILRYLNENEGKNNQNNGAPMGREYSSTTNKHKYRLSYTCNEQPAFVISLKVD